MILRKLTQALREQNWTAIDIERAFVDANPGLRTDMMSVACRRGVLQEVRICLTPGLEPRRCGADVIRDCTMTDAALDAVR